MHWGECSFKPVDFKANLCDLASLTWGTSNACMYTLKHMYQALTILCRYSLNRYAEDSVGLYPYLNDILSLLAPTRSSQSKKHHK